ncbi:MAG: hypothetical protein HYS83_01485 [Candidatus Blackburnbacteria bacterium]|nr:hypothetical protein [Candidatus Blackburnbacteria bacterium]
MEEQAQKAPPEGNSSLTKERTLFSWKAPSRPFKKRDKEFFTTVGALAFLIGLILFFVEGILPVAVVIALVFLIYVLSTVQPEEVEHSITNKGVVFAGKKYRWDELVRFWFTKRFGSDLLILESVHVPNRVEMVISDADKEKIKDAVEDYLIFEEAAPNFLDKAAGWLSKRVPLEG